MLRIQAGVHDFRVVVKALASSDAGVVVSNIVFDRVSSCPLSIAGDATATAAKDGLLLTRYLAGFRGDSLVAGLTLGSSVTAQSIESAIGNGVQYDVFGRTTPAAFATVDGLILVRLMLGAADMSLFNGISIPVDALYTTAAAVRANVNGRCGASF